MTKEIEKTTKKIEKITEEIATKTNEISALSLMDERKTAATVNDINKLKELRQKVEENTAKITALSDELYILNIEKLVLIENRKHLFFEYASGIIKEICAKYNGKQYGSKTKEKIYDECRNHGFNFYFDGYSTEKYQIKIYTLNAENYRDYKIEVDGYAADGGYFITKENTINVGNVIFTSNTKFVENPHKQAKIVAKKIKEYSDLTKSLETKRSELSAILPEGITRPSYISSYNVRF